MEDKNIKDLAEKDVGALIVELSIPGFMGNLVQTIYNFVDRLFISNMINEEAFAAVGQGYPIVMMGISLTMLFGAGGSTLFSLYLGKKDYKTAERVKANSLIFIMILVSLFVLITLLFFDDIIKYLRVSKEVVPYLKDYYGIIIPGRLIFVMGFAMLNFTRNEGQAKRSMYYIISGAIANTVLDPILIHFYGIKGAAYATVISQVITAYFNMRYHFKLSSIKIHLKSLFDLDLKMFWDIVTNGFALSFRVFAMSISNSILISHLNTIAGKISADTALSYGKILSNLTAVENIITIPIVGIAFGMQPIASYNFGSKNFIRVRKSLRYSTLYTLLICSILEILIIIFPDIFMRFFIRDPKVIEMGMLPVRLYFSSLFVKGLDIIFIRFFQSINSYRTATLFAVTRQFVVAIPLIFLLGNFMGINGIFLTSPATDFVSFSSIFLVYMFYTRKNRLKE